MKKYIKQVNEEKGLVQVTTQDERWYFKQGINKETGLPEMSSVPSVTWIAGYYPKGIGFYKWLAEHGWDEAESLKVSAGDKGSMIHEAIDVILAGCEVRIDSAFINKSTGKMEELTIDECDAILSFVKWQGENKPITIVKDYTIYSSKYGYAGTIDHIYMKEGEEVAYLQDFKSGQNIFREHEMQVSAYKQALLEDAELMEKFTELGIKEVKLELLQIGYKRNKNGYKVNEVEDCFDLFLTARKIWEKETNGEKPKQKDYPIILSKGVGPVLPGLGATGPAPTTKVGKINKKSK